MPASRSTSPISSPIASEARSPQAYISSSSARSRSAGRLGAARRPPAASRPRRATSTCGSRRLCLGARRCDGRVVGDQVLPAQMAVEGAQAGDLALQRRGRHRRAVAGPGREVGDELGQVAVARRPARRSRSAAGRRRTGAGPSGRPRACCATGRARTPGRRGSRAAGARTAAWAWRWPSDGPPSPPRTARPARCNAPPMERWAEVDRYIAARLIPDGSGHAHDHAVSPPQGALLELLARRDRRPPHPGDRHARRLQHALARARRCRPAAGWSRWRSIPSHAERARAERSPTIAWR